jgi:hypothetical protein
MERDPLPAHSLAEAYLYLMAASCPGCGRGPIVAGRATPHAHSDPLRLTIHATCKACKHADDYAFTVPGDLLALQAVQESRLAARVNPGPEPSAIVDVAQWIMLFRMISEAAARSSDKVEARQLGYEAAQCLEEALKFYDAGDDNDLPPDGAFFHDSSRRRRREHPQEFSRIRLIELRAKLPTLDVMEAERFVSSGHKQTRRKKWWPPW